MLSGLCVGTLKVSSLFSVVSEGPDAVDAKHLKDCVHILSIHCFILTLEFSLPQHHVLRLSGDFDMLFLSVMVKGAYNLCPYLVAQTFQY